MMKNKVLKKRIMVVDDVPDQIVTIRLIFEFNNEYEVIGANDGEECLDLLKAGNIPDIILLDIMMPKMDGWEVFRKIKRNSKWKDIPIIFLTALTGDDMRFGNITVDDFIKKPYDINDLKSKVIKKLNRLNKN
jgi:CheY-like chemotaxis protein